VDDPVVDEPTSFMTPTVSTAGSSSNPFDVSSFALSPPDDPPPPPPVEEADEDELLE
jgi:hypothetical protein